MPFVLEFSREIGCSVPRQDPRGLQVALYYLSLFLLASIPKCNPFVGLPPTYWCRFANKSVENIFAMFSAIWTNNVFPSFSKRMWFELSLHKIFPISFCRSYYFFVHLCVIFFSSLWYTLALLEVLPNIVEVASFAKQTLWW